MDDATFGRFVSRGRTLYEQVQNRGSSVAPDVDRDIFGTSYRCHLGNPERFALNEDTERAVLNADFGDEDWVCITVT